MLVTVYISTLHLWYSLEYLLNIFVSEILNWLQCLLKWLTFMLYLFIYFYNFIFDIKLCNNITELF